HTILESDAKIRLRVAKSYRNYDVGGVYNPFDTAVKGIPYYTFNTSCPVGLNEQVSTKKILLDAYPNPFSDGTYIKINMREKEHVVIKIFDMLGEEVITLADKTLPRGMHTFSWDGKSRDGVQLSNGVYMLSVRSDMESVSKSLML